VLNLSLTAVDLGCVKTHTSAKCGKYNSPSNCRAVCVQYDLALIICNAFEIFYARSERGRFYTAKTHSRHMLPGLATAQNDARPPFRRPQILALIVALKAVVGVGLEPFWGMQCGDAISFNCSPAQ
jgi:hypothetical protein